MNTSGFIAFCLTTILFTLMVTGVPTRPHPLDVSQTSISKPVEDVLVQENTKGLLPHKGDVLDRIVSTKRASSNHQAAEPSDEVTEFWKYVGKGRGRAYIRDLLKSKLPDKQSRSTNLARQVEVLTPFLPPHKFLTPSDDLLSATSEAEEPGVEPSPVMNEYVMPSPSMAPEDLAYPSYTPSPDGPTKQTFPSLTAVDNERGEITYRPWDSVYVAVRRFLNTFALLKIA